MTQKPKAEENILRAIIEHSPEQYEELVQASCLQDPGLVLKLTKLRARLQERDERAQLFGNSLAEQLNILVCSLRQQLGFATLAKQVVSAGIAGWAAEGKLLAAEIEPLVGLMDKAFADQEEADAMRVLIDDALGFWAEQRAHAFYRQRMHSQKDLAQLSQEILGDISAIQEVCRRVEEGDDSFIKTAGFSFFIVVPPVIRYPTPVTGLTAALGGGLARREATLVLAPQGAGKTVMACQLAAHYAVQGLNVLLISTEEGQARLDRRVFANMATLDYGKIKDNFNLTTVGQADEAKVMGAIDLLGGRMHIADWMLAGSDATIVSEEAFSELILRKERELAKSHGLPAFDVVMLDWVGSALGSFVELTSKGVPLRHLLLQAANNLADIAKKQNKIAVIFTQATAGVSYNRKRIDMSCLSECKDMGQRCANIVGISAMYQKDPGGESMSAAKLYAEMQWLCVSKSRFGEGGEIPVRRRFSHMRFENL